MKTFSKAALLAGLLTIGAAAPALADGPVIGGLGWVSVDAIKVNSNAWKLAEQQRPVTYKAQVDQANARAKAIQAQIAPLAQKFDRDRAAPTANQTMLQTEYGQIQQLQQAGEAEINGIVAPLQLSRAYVEEQVNAQLQKAINQAVAKRKLSMLVRAETLAFADPAYNMNQAVLDELNVLIPSAQLVPPAGWEPQEVRNQRAAASAGQAPGTAPAPAKKQPDGR